MNIVEAVQRYKDILDGIDDTERILAEMKSERDRIVQEFIPNLMHESGQSSCQLETGEKVQLEMIWTVEVPKDNSGANDYGPISEWLREKGFDAIIQDQVKFQKGADLSDIFGKLDERGIAYNRSASVHWMSLRKVLREHMETGGDAPPENAATVKVFERARIK